MSNFSGVKNFLTRKEELKSFWNRAPNYMAKGYEDVLALPSADSMLAEIVGSFSSGVWHLGADVNINASKIDTINGLEQTLSIGLEDARDRFNNGYTLCFADLSNHFATLSEIKESATDVFGSAELVQVTAYLSPSNSTGVLHFDSQHNFFIQREGVKRWFVGAKAAVENPFQNLVYPGATEEFFRLMQSCGYHIRQPLDCGKQEFLLEPGDVLYVPPGFYHSSETSKGHSLHFTLTIEPSSFWPALNKALYETLMRNTNVLNADERFLGAEELAEHRKICVDALLEAITKLRIG